MSMKGKAFLPLLLLSLEI
uniref:Uncharacterized protein n=1 Tax=Rhizophora mucronata TaxID=61149 RepID=A0A2P2QNK7_RHIMU